MAVRINISTDEGGLINEFVRLARECEEQGRGSTRRLDRQFAYGRASGFREAVELTDAALRSDKTGAPSELRNFEAVVKERGL